jgi:hypothetical protein
VSKDNRLGRSSQEIALPPQGTRSSLPEIQRKKRQKHLSPRNDEWHALPYQAIAHMCRDVMQNQGKVFSDGGTKKVYMLRVAGRRYAFRPLLFHGEDKAMTNESALDQPVCRTEKKRHTSDITGH